MDDKKKLKIGGILCLVLCIVSAFYGYERYQTRQEKPGAKLAAVAKNLVGDESRDIPVESKYAGLVALLAGLGGAGLLFKSR